MKEKAAKPERVLPEAPAHLSERAKQLWRTVLTERTDFHSAGRLLTLESALSAFDRAEEARVLVGREGMTQTTECTGAVHVHPCVKVERENRQLFARLWMELNLHWSQALDGRW